MLVFQVVLALILLLVGMVKLVALRPIREQFVEFGLPRWSMFAVGALEVAAGVGLLLPGLQFWASTGVALLLVGAVRSHVRVGHPWTQTAPAAVVLALAALHSVLVWWM